MWLVHFARIFRKSLFRDSSTKRVLGIVNMTINLKKKISSVFLILAFSAVAELLISVILGRALPEAEFGRFKFVNTVVLTLGTLLLLGQNTAIIKVVGKNDFARYNWRRFVLFCVVSAALLGILASGVAGWYYRFTYETVVIYFAFLAYIVVEYCSSILRSRGSYNFSMFLSKSASIGLFCAVAVGFLIFKKMTLPALLWVYVLSAAIPVAIGLWITHRFENGAEPLPRNVVQEGLILFLITVSYVILGKVDQFFIAKMLGYEALAGYSVIITITRGFDLVATALWFVLMPHYAKGVVRPIKSDAMKAGVAAMALALFYALFGGWLLHFLFRGKFDGSVFLIGFFIVIGICKVLYAIPSGIIGGRLSQEYLKVFLFASVAGIAINIGGNYFLIPLWGLAGSATATMVSWIFRVGFSYWLVYKEKTDHRGAVEEIKWESVS